MANVRSVILTGLAIIIVLSLATCSGGGSGGTLPTWKPDIFLYANNGMTGFELYGSDGTVAGTRLIKDINTNVSSGANSYISVNGITFFVASDDEHGVELWKSDGTEAGTSMVIDLNPGIADGVMRNPLGRTLWK